ncbi:MAG: DMT family transporter, partial [Verrucomicrobiota bacterium]
MQSRNRDGMLRGVTPANLTPPSKALRASAFLLLATVFWGLSFLTMKSLGMAQQKILPDVNSWFFAALSLVIRFGGAALILLLFSLRTWRHTTRREWEQGVGLGLVGGVGLLFQMDAVNHTEASTVAFLTQCTCLFVPIFVALQTRRWPRKWLVLNLILVMIGAAILSQINWRHLTLGRGEWETLVASVFFTAQILWLERPKFSGNNMNHVTIIMFALNLLSVLPVFFAVKPPWPDVLAACQPTPILIFYGILTVLCTLVAYTLMNYWQPQTEASRAGLIYCAEPMFASVFALFLPAIFSRFADIRYDNETITRHLLIGGGLIMVA